MFVYLLQLTWTPRPLARSLACSPPSRAQNVVEDDDKERDDDCDDMKSFQEQLLSLLRNTILESSLPTPSWSDRITAGRVTVMLVTSNRYVITTVHSSVRPSFVWVPQRHAFFYISFPLEHGILSFQCFYFYFGEITRTPAVKRLAPDKCIPQFDRTAMEVRFKPKSEKRNCTTLLPLGLQKIHLREI